VEGGEVRGEKHHKAINVRLAELFDFLHQVFIFIFPLLKKSECVGDENP
jgi:hypothetical protein